MAGEILIFGAGGCTALKVRHRTPIERAPSSLTSDFTVNRLKPCEAWTVECRQVAAAHSAAFKLVPISKFC